MAPFERMDKEEARRAFEEIQRQETGEPVHPDVVEQARSAQEALQAQDDAIAAAIEQGERIIAAREKAGKKAEAERDKPKAVTTAERSFNELRPSSFNEIIGQDRVKRLLRRVIDATLAQGRPLDHVLFVGASGMGKSTFSHVIAAELGVTVYEVEAPVSIDTLLDLRMVMKDRDILRVEEIHQQAIAERRGRSAATQPEVMYACMEDRVIATPNGVVQFPAITIIGTTTDEGMLPDAFVNRFPLKPVFDPYTETDLTKIAHRNAKSLGVTLTAQAAQKFARASRGVPRHVNNYTRNALMLAPANGKVDSKLATEVLRDLNRVEEDGLTADMVAMLTFLYEKAGRTNADGERFYQASVSTIATATGKSRDSRAIVLRVEPFLIQQGYVQVTHGGRRLTDQGIERAKELVA